MQFCPQCGNELPDENQFCSKCGKQLKNEPQLTSPPVVTRPTGITILGILHIIGGTALAILAIMLGAVSTTMMGHSFMGSMMSVFGGALAVVFGILSVIEFVIAFALFSGKRWGRTVIIVFSILDLVLEVVSIAGGNGFAIVGILLDLFVLYYMWRPHVIAYFYK